MPSQGWKFGSFAGAPILLSPSFLILAAVVAFVNLPSEAQRFAYGSAAWALPLGTVVILFLSVLTHELAHAVVGRASGLQASQIVVDVWGGHTTWGRATPSAGRSAVVAAVGPAANFVLAGLAWAALISVQPISVLRPLLFSALLYNVILGVFNLLPGLPLDGGYLLESFVWKATGRRATGTLAAGWVGRAVAVALVAYGVLQFGRGGGTTALLWSGLIALVLWQAASGAIKGAATRRRAEDVDLRALTRPAIAVDGAVTAAEAARSISEHGGFTPQYVVVTHAGRPHGIVRPADVFSLATMHPATPIGQVAAAHHPDDQLDIGATGDTLLVHLGALASENLVMTDEGRVVGVLPTEALVPVLFGHP